MVRGYFPVKQFCIPLKKSYEPKTTILNFSGVNDPAETVSVGSLTPMNFVDY
jgi:hypothetical protein